MVTLEQIQLAQKRLRGVAARTPLISYFPPARKQNPAVETNFAGRNRKRAVVAQGRESAAHRLIQAAWGLQQDRIVSAKKSASGA